MKVLCILLIVLDFSVPAFTQVVAKKVDISESLSRDEFLKRKDVKSLFKKCNDFEYNINFEKRYESELIMFLNSKAKGGTLFIIRWDSLSAEIYHENFRGSGVELSNAVVRIDSMTFNSFIDLEEVVKNHNFYRQFTRNETSYYDTDFLVLKHSKGELAWAVCSFNGREFRDGTNYPSLSYSTLVEFILLEFGGLP